MAVGGHRSFNLGLIWLAAPLRTDYALSTLLGSWRRITAKKSALATMKHTICSRSKYQMSLINHRTNSNYQIQILQQIRTTLIVPKILIQEFFKASTNQFFLFRTSESNDSGEIHFGMRSDDCEVPPRRNSPAEGYKDDFTAC
jgi:hypothetical protein